MTAPDLARLRVVDLSVTLAERFPTTWPGHMPFAHKNWSWFTETALPTGGCSGSLGPYQTNFVILDEHAGTHVDGPTHFIPPEGSDLPWAGPGGAVTGDLLDLSRLMGPAAVIDVRELADAADPGISPFVTDAHIGAWEAANGDLQPGEVALLRTGWSRHYASGPDGRRYVFDPVVTRATPGWPALSPEAAAHLHERGVTTVGIDAPSMGAAHDGIPVHREGLSRGMLYVEMLANLESLPVRGALFVFLPIKIANSTGGPGRAVALVP